MNNSFLLRWQPRRFVSLGTLFSGLALPVTGIADHLARHSSGPHADAGWIVAHVAIGALFIFFAASHAAFNRHALLRHLLGEAPGTSELRGPHRIVPGRRQVGGRGDTSRDKAATAGVQTMVRARGVSSSSRAGRDASPFVALDRSRCVACWECVSVCPQSVIGKVEFWRHRHAVISAGHQCSGCRRCVKVCTAGALSCKDGDDRR